MLQACVDQRVTSARELVFQLPDAVAPSLGAIVAIPVRDEEDRIEACLDALLAQRDLSGRRLPADALGLVLLLNNCSDRTAAIVRGVSPPAAHPSPWWTSPSPLSQANAGFARRLALELAALWLERAGRCDGVLPDDRCRQPRSADTGSPRAWRRSMPAAVPWRGGSRSNLRKKGCCRRHSCGVRHARAPTSRLCWRCPPASTRSRTIPGPIAGSASGASYGVTFEAYRAIGGLPYPASGEDRALAERRCCATIFRSGTTPISLSSHPPASTAAPAGGVADTIRMRCDDPEAPGDERLEPLPNVPADATAGGVGCADGTHCGLLRPRSGLQQPSWQIPLGFSPLGMGGRKQPGSARSGRRSRRRARSLRARLCGRATCRCIRPRPARCSRCWGSPASRQRHGASSR